MPDSAPTSRLRPNILAARQRLAGAYAEFRQRHLAGCPGLDLCRAIGDLRDDVLHELFEAALADLGLDGPGGLRSQLALVAHGGYGRREVAPWSDVDLMVLHAPGMADQVARLAERLMRDVFDAGLILGHSVRTPRQACQSGWQDAQVCTSLIESRLLTGSEAVFRGFIRPFRRRLHRRARPLMAAIDQSRLQERAKYGETVYLLEPNVKRSRGGLRDIQLLRWIGMVRYGTPVPDELRAIGALSEEDHRAVTEATEFLLRLRNELHFHSGRASDVLHRGEQLRIARDWGYQPAAGLLPVEQFMRDCFRHTSQVSHVTARFVAKARFDRGLGRVWTNVFGHRVGRDFRVGPGQIRATGHALRRFRGDLAAVMRLADLANLYDKQIAPDTWEAVAREAPGMSDDISPAALSHFFSLLSCPTRLGELLHGLHEVRLLEKFIPGFAHARGLLQFNQYHKYTVDEHCLRAVEEAAGLMADPGPLGRVYRGLAQKRLLHLALLIHDLGKGHPGDHSQVGLGIARDVAARLGLAPRDAEALCFLVENHLMMNHLAFRRDTGDEQLVVRFAVEVGSPELLRMLYVMTAADMGSVGPGVWTSWKSEVLTDLYHRAMQHLAGDSPLTTVEQQGELRRAAILAAVAGEKDQGWFLRQTQGLPRTYLNATPPEQIAADLRLLHSLQPGDVSVAGEYQPGTETVLFTIGTQESLTPGIFHKLTGALTSQGLEILSAQINTLDDGLVLDRFWTHDPDFVGQPPPGRLQEVSAALECSLRAPPGKGPSFRRTWHVGGHQAAPLPAAQTRVRADNTTSRSCTVLDVLAVDRPGLLYCVARTLFEQGLSVWRAKIGTFLDQVVDVFYVTDQAGRKIEDDARLDEIARRVTAAIEDLAKQ
jgi:[protein-PII] uridylyltransferase